MASKNVQTVLSIYECFNKRDLEGAVAAVSDDLKFESHGLGETYKSRSELRDSFQAWVGGFSNGKITEPKVIDAGDTVIAQFVGEGTNDGPMGPFQKATGRSVSVPFVDIWQFDAQGRIIGGETYFDMLTMLIQLGHAERPAQK